MEVTAENGFQRDYGQDKLDREKMEFPAVGR